MSKIPEIIIEETKAVDKRLESAQSELDANPKLFMEVSLYGEALRLRAELLPKPQRIVINPITKQEIILPAESGIDVFTCTLDELSTALEDAKLNKYRVRTEFLLRVIATRFKNEFDPSTVNISKTETDILTTLKTRAKNDCEFLGECGFGITPEGIRPTLQRVL